MKIDSVEQMHAQIVAWLKRPTTEKEACFILLKLNLSSIGCGLYIYICRILIVWNTRALSPSFQEETNKLWDPG